MLYPFEVYNSVILVYSQICTVITTINFKTFHHLKKNPVPLAISPHPSPPNIPVRASISVACDRPKNKSNINRTNNFFITYKVLKLIFRLNKSSTYHDIELPFNLNIASISLFGSKLVYSEYSIFYDDRIFRILYII